MMFNQNSGLYGNSTKPRPILRPVYKGGVKDTSVAALIKHEPKLSAMCQRIKDYVGVGKIHTRAELAKHLNIPTSTMSGRVNEMLRRGILVEAKGRWKCSVTGNMVRGVRQPA